MMSILNKNSIFLIIIILMSSFAFICVNSTNLEPASADQTRFISFGDSPHVPEGEVENYLKMLIDAPKK